MIAINVNFLDSLLRRAEVLAQEDGIPLNQFIASALGEKVAVINAFSHLRERAARGRREKLDRVLAMVPDVEPPEYDRLTPPAPLDKPE